MKNTTKEALLETAMTIMVGCVALLIVYSMYMLGVSIVNAMIETMK